MRRVKAVPCSPVSVVASVKFELLKAWVALKTFPGISSVDKLSDEILLT